MQYAVCSCCSGGNSTDIIMKNIHNARKLFEYEEMEKHIVSAAVDTKKKNKSR